jgi:outer membrane protein TolC
LGASLAVLTPAFTVNAQNANPRTYIPASRISQQVPSSNPGLDGDFNASKRPSIGTLKANATTSTAVNSEIPLKEIYPKASRPTFNYPRPEKKLIAQVRRSSLEPATEQSAPQQPSSEPAVKLPSKVSAKVTAKLNPLDNLPEIPPKLQQPANLTASPDPAPPKSAAITPQSPQEAQPTANSSNPNTSRAKLPGKKPALLTATAVTKPALSTSVMMSLDAARAKLTGKDPILGTATPTTKAEPSPSEKSDPDSTQAKLPAPHPLSVTAASATKPDAPSSIIIEPDSSKQPIDESAKTTTPPIDLKTTKVAIGLDPRQPLVVPTTPSQVKIERVQPITLKEALELVDRNSPTIAQARIAVERRKAQLDEAVAARNPTVNAQVGYDYTNSASTQAGNTLLPPRLQQSPISNTLTGSVGINYNVYTSGQVDASIRAAENALRSSEADFNRIAQTTRLSVATAYYSAQNADGQVRIREQQVQNSERSLQDTEALERAGVGTKFDVLQSQVQLANARQNLSSAQADQANSRRELARQLSYPPNLDLLPADEIKPADDWKPGLEETILLALKNRSELDVQKLQREVARDNAKAALAALGPQVGLFANFDQFENFNQAGGIGLGYRAGFNINWTLFDGGAANARANQAEADRALAEVRFTEAGNQARFDVESAYNNLKSRREQIESTTLAVKQANEALRLSRLRLSAGVGTQLEVLRSQDDLTQADVNRLNAIVGFNQALVQLQRAINGL